MIGSACYPMRGMATVLGLCIMLLMTAQAEARSIARFCNPVAVKTCALPFPSDLYRDAESGQLDLADTLLDRDTDGRKRFLQEIYRELPESVRPSAVFNGSSGFSPLGPILFELPHSPSETIPEDGEGVVLVFDKTRGQVVDVLVRLSDVAAPERDLRERQAVLEVWPRTRFEFGHHYVAVLLKGLTYGDETSDMPLSYGMRRVLSEQRPIGITLPKTWDAYQPALTFLNQQGVANDQILQATFFTVRPREELTRPWQPILAAINDYPYKFGEFQREEPIGSEEYGLALLRGHVQLPNFRSDDGGVYPPYDPIELPSQENVEMIITLPRVEEGTVLPTMVFGHGLGNRKEITQYVFSQNDAMGIATLAIDFPNHGARVVPGEDPAFGYITNQLTSPSFLPMFFGMLVQGVVDQISFSRALTQKLLPSYEQARESHDDLPALDISRMAYKGLSYGAILGSTSTVHSDDYQGAYLLGGAGKIMQTMSASVFWDGIISRLIPVRATGAEATFMMAMMQHRLDFIDSMNVIELYRAGPSRPAKPLAVQYSIDDTSVPNDAIEGLAEFIGLPLLTPVIEPNNRLVAGESGADDFQDGFGLVQAPYGLRRTDEVIQQIEQFDDELLPDVTIEPFATLLQSVNTDWIPAEYRSLIELSEDQLAQSENLNDLVEVLYEGEVRGFLTHFNMQTTPAQRRSQEWNCYVLEVEQNLCQRFTPEIADDQVEVAAQANYLVARQQEESGGSIYWQSLILAFLMLLRRRVTGCCKSPMVYGNRHACAGRNFVWRGFQLHPCLRRDDGVRFCDGLVRGSDSG